MLHAFTTKPDGMLNYLSNHVGLVNKRSKKKYNTKAKWVDELKEAITKRCFLVQNIVSRFNSIKGNGRKARDSRMKALSELSTGFSYETIVRVCVVCLCLIY